MIVLDIETSGLTGREGIWQIGAINLDNTEDYFLEEARIDKEDGVIEGALKLTGKTEADLRDPTKQMQKQLILNYLTWFSMINEKIILGHNVGWDITLIQDKCIKYGFHDQFLKMHGQRGLDLQTLAQNKYFEFNREFLLNENGISGMKLEKVLNFCGIEDKRNYTIGNDLVKQGTFHNALEDCKLEAECFSRIMYGKSLFKEFFDCKIPGDLIK